jgi:hypothetical protein
MKTSTRYQIFHFATIVSACLTIAFPILITLALAMGYPKHDHYCSISMYFSKRCLVGYSFAIFKGEPHHVWADSMSLLAGNVVEGISFEKIFRAYSGWFSTYVLTLPLMLITAVLAMIERKYRRMIRQRAFPIGTAATLGYEIPPQLLTERAKRHATAQKIHA